MQAQYPQSLLRYLKMFQEDPNSRIFAPLAESYRRLGMLEEAIEICKEGLAVHPDFVGGKVALARSYFDKKDYSEVRKLMAPVLREVPDNLIAQRLYADASLVMGFAQEALASYKMLLYLCPYDKEVEVIVSDLESQSYQAGGLVRGGKISIGKQPEKLRQLMKLQKILNRIQAEQTKN